MASYDHDDTPAPRGFGRLDALSVLVVAAMAAGVLWFTANAPEGQYPAHMGLSGTVDRWADKSEFILELWMLTGITALIAALMAWLAHDRRMAGQVRRAGPIFAVGRVVALIAPALAVVLITGVGLGWIRPGEDQTTMVRLIMGFVALVILAVGEPMGKTKPNAIAGVRTYFTLTSRLAWDKSNRLAGRLFFWIGLLGLVAAPFAPQPHAMVAFIGAVIGSILWVLVESWRVWKSDPERREAA